MPVVDRPPTVPAREPLSAAPTRPSRYRWLYRGLAVGAALVVLAGAVLAGRWSVRWFPLYNTPEGAPSLYSPAYLEQYPDLQVIDDPTVGEVWMRRQPALRENTLAQEGFTRENGIPRYQKDGVVSQWGVDISDHQGSVNWQAVKNAGVDFAMLRIGYRGYSYGKINEDSRFRENIAGAQKAGLRVGVYFFSQALTVQEAQEEADFVTAILKDYSIDLPVALDWEAVTQDEARTDTMESEEITTVCRAFCERIAQSGYTPMIYMYKVLAYRRLTLGDFPQVAFWIAELADTPHFFYEFSLWQYSQEGRVDGIDAPVDLNLGFFREDGRLLQEDKP